LFARRLGHALLQGVLESFHFPGEALHLAAEFVHAGVLFAPWFRSASGVRTRIGDALGSGEGITAIAPSLFSPLRTAMMLLRIGTTCIAATLGIHAVSFGKIPTLSITTAVVVAKAALSERVLKTFRDITQSGFTKMLQCFTDMSLTIGRRCGMLRCPLSI
jgi:hypothetical protein